VGEASAGNAGRLGCGYLHIMHIIGFFSPGFCVLAKNTIIVRGIMLNSFRPSFFGVGFCSVCWLAVVACCWLCASALCAASKYCKVCGYKNHDKKSGGTTQSGLRWRCVLAGG